MTLSLFTVALALPSLVAEGGAGSILGNPMLPMVGMFVIIYFMVLRPMKNQEKDRKARLEGLKKGDEVQLNGGIIGRVSNIDGNLAIVEIADRVKVRVVKSEIHDTREAAAKAAKDKDKGKKDEAKDAKSAS
ncbi:MAG: preprotein translocase subunit YajC [Nannocystaceae bacterium]|nr:preprotein translocase subunit YajC [bacterium]